MAISSPEFQQQHVTEYVSLFTRTLWTITGLALLIAAATMQSNSAGSPLTPCSTVILGGWGLGCAASTWLPERMCPRRLLRALQHATLGIVLLASIVATRQQIMASAGYPNDLLALNQYAALVQLHHLNPYTHALIPGLSLYQVPQHGLTELLTGHPLGQLTMPALSFELLLPFLAIGWGTQLVVGVNVGFWVIGVLLLYLLIPRQFQALAMILGALGIALGAVGMATPAIIAVPWLLMAAYRWRRWCYTHHWKSWIGPICLGVACACSSIPWLLVPFMIVAIFRESQALDGTRKALKTGGIYFAIVVGIFLLPNLPYLISSPVAWVRDVSAPFGIAALPAPTSLSGVALAAGVGSGHLLLELIGSGCVLIIGVVLFVVSYPTGRRLLFFAPAPLVLLLPGGLPDALLFFIPASLVAILSAEGTMSVVHDGAFEERIIDHNLHAWQHAQWLSIALVVFVVATVCVPLLVPQPLQVTITGVETTGEQQTIDEISVAVQNLSGANEHPHFTVGIDGTPTTAWAQITGPTSIAPHHGAAIDLVATTAAAQPSLTTPFEVIAMLTDPAFATSSQPYQMSTNTAVITTPQQSGTIGLNIPITLNVQVTGPNGQPIRQAHLDVFLSQIGYGEQGAVATAARINGEAIGATPVDALTNAGGIATFTIVEGTQSSVPVSFQAHLENQTLFTTYGYSQIYIVRYA